MLSRPYVSRIPDQSLIIGGIGEGASDVQATRSAEGTYALVYIPQANQTVEVDLASLETPLAAMWYDARTGKSWPIGTIDSRAGGMFTTPLAGPDWVLVLDSVAAAFPAPGAELSQEG